LKPSEFEAGVASIAALKDATRRRLYLYVVSEAEPVGREAAARAVGVGRTLAAFHLDQLVDAGLLDVEYRRLSGRTGPGAGRPAKVYRRSARTIEITLPARRYDVAGRLLAQALTEADPAGQALALAARQHGADLAEAVQRRARDEPSSTQALLGVLTDQGYEPELAPDGAIVLRNCPFRTLAAEHAELICQMNFEAIRALLAALPETPLRAALEPSPPFCCVKVSQADVV